MFSSRFVGAGLVLALCCFVPLRGEDDAKDKGKNGKNPAAVPMERNVARHKQFLKRAEKGDVEVLFLGDSITQGWEGSGRKVWAETFGPMKAANFGIGGDQTGHVLWRITEGKELEGINPKVAVVMIGTNNMGRHSPEQIAGGVEAIVKELRKQKPKMKVLVLAIFPRSAGAKDAIRMKVKKTNEILEKDLPGLGKSVVYKDIGEKFLDKEGNLTKEIMPDYLHLSEKGYRLWADAIKDDVKKLVGD